MSRKQKSMKKIFILAAVALVTAVCGIWLLLTPRIERDYVYAAQETMLDELMHDIQNATEPPDAAAVEVEYAECMAAVYADFEETETPTDCSLYQYSEDCTTEYASGYEYETAIYEPTYEPIPDTAFPNAITGIGILTIDTINLRLPIAEGVDEATLRIAPGRVPQTAQIGNIGNAVIAGHRNYTFGSMFNRLGELVHGDIVQYQARNGEMMEFEVFEVAIIEPHDQVAFLQPVNESIITLYTCTPIRTATHRLIIRAQRIS